ncbi:DUF4333 domain-containing protein [Streptomyces sp. Go-475]|uniref:DUF4333 domain-containing protein n=1 Tax=Streptomyces sp. Go-475 TaxID=2072505 RepID=UPI000DF0ABF2|nr:DUF4333 domain-containing protein [Streptomyces sp. Go-475]AXE90524.1 hypothetical protein C1703_36375 [Streptomyces sp. Go-475]
MRTKMIFAVAAAALVGAGAAGSVAVADMNVQKNTADPAGGGYAEVQDHPGLSGDLVATHIETWYHPLPWIGKEIDDVSCPDLAAVRNTKISCTAKSGGTRISVPVSVVDVAGAAAPRVTWKFER